LIFASVFIWWLWLQLFGLVGLPLALRLLGNLPDRGYAFARPLGLLLTGYLLWLGGSLGFWSNGIGGTLIAMLVVAGVGLWLYLGRRAEGDSLLPWLRAHTAYWLTVELLFAASLAGWAVYKAYNPNLETAGGEKWMEIAFVNATLRSDGFPPQDPWLSGFGISYYYFGYVLMAMLTRLSGLAASVAYNLFIPTLVALTLTGAFSIVYNLVMTGGEARGQGLDLRRALGFGLLGALFVGILGNLEGLFEVLHSRGLFPASFWSWLDIKDINQPPSPAGWVPTRFIWWWRASRVIHDCSFQGLLSGNCNPPNGDWEVIDEFPFFSFMLGDVHPHVLALPFVLLALALALNVLSNRQLSKSANPQVPFGDQQIGNLVNLKTPLSTLQSLFSDLIALAFGGWAQFLLYALCLGALGFLNTWDFPIYLFVVTLAFALQRVLTGARNWAAEAIAAGLGLGILGGIMYLPFYLGFQSQAGGILPNLFNPTRLQQFLVFFGPFLFVIISYLVIISRGAAPLDGRRRLPSLLALTWGGPVAAVLAVGLSLTLSPSARTWVEDLLRQPDLQALLGNGNLRSLALMATRIRLSHPWTFLFLGGLLAWVLLLLTADSRRQTDDRRPTTAVSDQASAVSGQPSAVGGQLSAVGGRPSAVGQLSAADLFALILIGVGLLLPLAVEFVYLRDLFGTRMNTVFKFYFQAWVLLALAAAYAASVVLRRVHGLAGMAWRLGLTLLVLAGLVYPALAIPNKTGNFGGEPTLDGMAWLQTAHPDDYAAIRWLQANAPDGAVILEAPGDSYSYTGRVSALTGLPTPLGWDFHEFQWRGSYDEPARRQPEIDILYNSVDPAQTLTLLDKYAITYVYVGPLERQRYNPSGLAKFERLMDVVNRQGEVTIYQRRGTP
jgi:YYY domain-containing protein